MKRQVRELRVLAKRLIGIEPKVRETLRPTLEYHGTAEAGWKILARSLKPNSVIVDVGVGEDLSFSTSISRTYGCLVSAFDPTPRAIRYVSSLDNDRIRLFELGLGSAAGRHTFYLPNNSAHVSGSLHQQSHLGREAIDVDIVTIDQLFSTIGCARIDVLKLDIEGSEYDVIESEAFRDHAGRIDQLCVEFHHRWEGRGRHLTNRAVATLRECGLECAWYSRSTNEEFTFVRPSAARRTERHTIEV